MHTILCTLLDLGAERDLVITTGLLVNVPLND
jgi:hypothetical protein